MRHEFEYYHDGQFFEAGRERDEDGDTRCHSCGASQGSHWNGHCPAGDDPDYLRSIGQNADGDEAKQAHMQMARP